MIQISVIIPTYNPSIIRLQKTLYGLKNQSLKLKFWELIIIDNNSSIKFENSIDLVWHPNHRIIQEPIQGLTYARIKGFNVAQGQTIVLVDDDNVLNENYLELLQSNFDLYPRLGVIGGKSFPLFDSPPAPWLHEFYSCLALRDLGDEMIFEDWQNQYPPNAPIGAGMGIRKLALKQYLLKTTNATGLILDRNGTSLSSGGDNDIVLSVIKSGWRCGYDPKLVLYHVIPVERQSKKYLARLVRDSNKSWMKLLTNHEINPWRKIPEWSVPLRKLKAWFTYGAWRSQSHYIRWKGACGTFEGLAN